jgi:hypothetical protein
MTISKSGLLAGVAAQLFSYFRDPMSYNRRPTSQGARDTVLAICYGALFLNIGATIGAFIIIDKMGSLTIVAARRRNIPIGQFGGTEMALLQHYGAGKSWKYLIWHCKLLIANMCLIIKCIFS